MLKLETKMRLKDFVRACDIYARMNIKEDASFHVTMDAIAEYFGGCVTEDASGVMRIDLCVDCVESSEKECPCNLWEYVAGFVLDMLTPKILLMKGHYVPYSARSAME